ncbi:D-aminoacylase [Streptomyces sodiiphilus]|uniref:D-aminoacylase n=1 Tax=Streptomyces sodiiphilus TaxID=226217 RepID=A0ABN2NXU8_9ACTN
MPADLVLRGGTVLDGTGSPGRREDVAVSGGRVLAVGRDPGIPARRVLDVSGAVVCPGFIDLHSHADFTVMANPGALTQITQGVTTLVTGNCGFSPFPVVPEHAHELIALSGFLADGLDWNWSTAGEFATAVDRLPLAVNVALQVGHGALRTAAMGTADRAPTVQELALMRDLLRQAVADGAVGLSSGLIYPPGAYAGSAELTGLAGRAAAAGLLYSTHLRDEGDRLGEAVREALDVARRTGVRLQISHLKSSGRRNWGAVEGALKAIEEARAEGLDVAADQYPYSASSTTLTSVLPGRAMDGGVAGLLARIADPEQYRRLAAELAAEEGAGFAPDRIVLADTPQGPFRAYVGRSVAQIAAELGVPAGQAVLDILWAQRGQAGIVHHSMSEDDVRRVMRHPAVAVASDGWVLGCPGRGLPHPRSLGTFARVLGRYARDERVLELPEAVRRMTSLPAARLRSRDRGVLRPGAVADLAVFDPDAVTDRATYDRPWQTATGVLHTVVAGRLVLEDGRATGEAPGRVLRGPGWSGRARPEGEAVSPPS